MVLKSKSVSDNLCGKGEQSPVSTPVSQDPSPALTQLLIKKHHMTEAFCIAFHH